MVQVIQHMFLDDKKYGSGNTTYVLGDKQYYFGDIKIFFLARVPETWI